MFDHDSLDYRIGLMEALLLRRFAGESQVNNMLLCKKNMKQFVNTN